MSSLLVLLLLILVVLTIQARRRANEANQRIREIIFRLTKVEAELLDLKEKSLVWQDESGEPKAQAARAPQTVETTSTRVQDVVTPQPEYPESRTAETEEVFSLESTRAPEVDSVPSEPIVEPSVVPKPRLNLEQFLGVKLFAWAAGLALFLGVAFFLKWSFDQGIVTPPVRVAMGIAAGLGFLLGGLWLPRERYAVLVQALTAAGVLVLYADIFASCSFYRFIGQITAFALMSLVTATAFLLSSRLGSPTVAILGLLGGFLTPPLLSTGVDRPFGLFSYIALLDVGLLAVALYNRWNYLSILSAAATVAMQIGWAAKFFAAEKTMTGMGIFLAFAFLYMLALFYAHRREQVETFLCASCLLMPTAAIAFCFYLVARPYPSVAARPWVLFGFFFAVDAVLLAQAALRKEIRQASVAAGSSAFLLLMLWTFGFLTNALLSWALALYLLFALLHSIYPVVLERLRPSDRPTGWTAVFPILSLALVMIPIFKLTPLSPLVWPAILLIDMLAVILAFITASVLGILAVMIVTVLAICFWILKMDAILTGLPEVLFIIGGFAVLFFVIGLIAAKKFATAGTPEQRTLSGSWFSLMKGYSRPEIARSLIPALSALLPFLLLMLLTVRLPLSDPSSVFGMAGLMAVLLLAMVRYLETDWVGLAGLAGVVLLEATWHFSCLKPDHATTPLIWYVGFYGLFAVFPFVTPSVKNRILPWVVSALAGPAQFFLLYKLMVLAFGVPYMGALPAAFAIASLAALIRLLRVFPEASIHRTQIALFGGVTLFFVTLIFPIQFEKQWITISWALEGVALLWLFHRVSHDGLRWVGAALLVTAFLRLALNPAVLTYHMRAQTPILNWYLYTYGIVTLCLFAAARLLRPPHNILRSVNTPPLLASLATALAFLLVNIEIADYFSVGAAVTFEFSGNFGRDMTYSLAWGIFAFALLLSGILKQIRGARYAGIGLLVGTLIKLFLHDLWRLGGLYRIGSLVGLALVLIPVSFLYQRFLSTGGEKTETTEERS